MPIADYGAECCFICLHRSIVETCKVSGSSWGERAEKADAAERRKFQVEFYRRCGVKRPDRTMDIHWPMTLSIRAPVMAADGTPLRASGLRQRSAKAIAKRNEQKRQRIEQKFGRNSDMDWRNPRAWRSGPRR